MGGDKSRLLKEIWLLLGDMAGRYQDCWGMLSLLWQIERTKLDGGRLSINASSGEA